MTNCLDCINTYCFSVYFNRNKEQHFFFCMWLTHHSHTCLYLHTDNKYMPVNTHILESLSFFYADNTRWGGGHERSLLWCFFIRRWETWNIHRDKTIGEMQRDQQQTFHLLSFHQKWLLLLSDKLFVFSLSLSFCVFGSVCVLNPNCFIFICISTFLSR